MNSESSSFIEAVLAILSINLHHQYDSEYRGFYKWDRYNYYRKVYEKVYGPKDEVMALRRQEISKIIDMLKGHISFHEDMVEEGKRYPLTKELYDIALREIERHKDICLLATSYLARDNIRPFIISAIRVVTDFCDKRQNHLERFRIDDDNRRLNSQIFIDLFETIRSDISSEDFVSSSSPLSSFLWRRLH